MKKQINKKKSVFKTYPHFNENQLKEQFKNLQISVLFLKENNKLILHKRNYSYFNTQYDTYI